jgi:uncharacterized damage-inducible protein DinB
MKVADVMTLVEYNEWATGHVLDAAARVAPEQFTAPPRLNTASLQATLVHVLSAQRLLRTRLADGTSSPTLRPEEFPNVDVLRAFWQEETATLRAYLRALDDGALEETVRFRRLSGELSDPIVRWHVVMQMLTHGAQHRSEAALLLTEYGQSPGDLDFIVFVLRLR